MVVGEQAGGQGAAMYAAGFEPWDVHVRDLLSGRITLEGFRGIVFMGGFSYADVLEWDCMGGMVEACAVQLVRPLCVRLHSTADIGYSSNQHVCEKQRYVCTVMREYSLQQSDFNGSITASTRECISQFGRVCHHMIRHDKP